jgi:hypothetical protein
MARRAVPALQVVLAAVFLVLLVVQVVVLPEAAADSAERFPEAASLRWPVLLLAIATVACAQVAVVCIGTWLAGIGRPGGADRSVDVFIAAVATASGLVLVIGGCVSATVGSPLWAPCAVASLLGAGLALLVTANADRLATLG